MNHTNDSASDETIHHQTSNVDMSDNVDTSQETEHHQTSDVVISDNVDTLQETEQRTDHISKETNKHCSGCPSSDSKKMPISQIESLSSTEVAATIKLRCSQTLLEHIRVITSLIEGRSFSQSEIKKMLIQSLRQHSYGRRTRMDYSVDYLNTMDQRGYP